MTEPPEDPASEPWPTGRHAHPAPSDESSSRATGNAVLGGAVLLGVVVATLAIVQWAGDTNQAPFEPGSAADVLGAAGRAGLQICSVRDEPDPLARQATSSSTVRIATDCAVPTPPAADPRRSTSDDATAVIDRYASVADRDANARELTSRIRPRGSGVVYTWRDMTIVVRGDGDDAVRERLESVLRGSGAV